MIFISLENPAFGIQETEYHNSLISYFGINLSRSRSRRRSCLLQQKGKAVAVIVLSLFATAPQTPHPFDSLYSSLIRPTLIRVNFQGTFWANALKLKIHVHGRRRSAYQFSVYLD